VQELWLVDVDERVVHVLRPDGEYHEWVDGDTVATALLPGFGAAIAELIAIVS
jgi:Uma2 family endonuclease